MALNLRQLSRSESVVGKYGRGVGLQAFVIVVAVVPPRSTGGSGSARLVGDANPKEVDRSLRSLAGEGNRLSLWEVDSVRTCRTSSPRVAAS